MSQPWADERLRLLVERVEQAIPFHRHLGIRVWQLAPARCVLHVPWQEHLVGDPSGPWVHGGVAPALANTAGGLACLMGLGLEHVVRTVSLQVEYLQPGRTGELFCTAELATSDAHTAVSQVELFSGALPQTEAERQASAIARAQVRYRLVRADQ